MLPFYDRDSPESQDGLANFFQISKTDNGFFIHEIKEKQSQSNPSS